GIPLALATSAPKENAELITGRLGIARCFSAMVTGHEVKAAKPDPAIFLEAARRLGVPPSQCVVFEDSPAGVTAAVRAGARCVALATSVPAEKLLAEGARLALRSEEHTSELQSRENLVCRLLLEKKKHKRSHGMAG